MMEDRAIVQEEPNENEKALAGYTEAIRLAQDNDGVKDAYWNRALLFDKMERHAEAIADYLTFLRLNPGDENVKIKLMEKAGDLLISGCSPQNPVAKQVAVAIDIYTKIIEQDESYPHVWTQRGFVKLLGVRYFGIGELDNKVFSNYEAALSDLDRAIAEDDEDGEAYAFRAQIHRSCGHNDSALEDLQRAFDLSSPAWWLTAIFMYNDGIELPEEMLADLRKEGFIDSNDDEEIFDDLREENLIDSKDDEEIFEDLREENFTNSDDEEKGAENE
jgi:tetratricopeptide (TPR) repeat protein